MLDRITRLLHPTDSTVKNSLASLHVSDSESFWHQLADKHGVWLPELSRIKDVPLERLDAIAKTLIRRAERTAFVQGVGFGFGGIATVLPDASFLSAIILRLTRRLCLLYGIETHDANARAEMWKAAAAAAGVDYTKGFTEKHLLKKFAPQIVEHLAPKIGSEVAAKLATRFVPIANSAIGGAVNFSFVRAWGRRLQRELRARYLSLESESLPTPYSTSEPIAL
jgi:uncharacterized protein (DUF697 family)